MRIDPRWRERRLRLVGTLGAAGVKAWIGSLRCPIDLFGSDQLPDHEPCIVAVWHETLVVPLKILAPQRPYTLISQSDDGELIARVAGALGWRIVRGSSSRGAAMAMRGLLAAAKRSECFQAVITVDGPRGPRRRCKDGVVYLASRLGIPLAPLGVYVHRAWRARSWDRFVLPKPLSRAAMIAGERFHIPADLSTSEIAEHCRRIDEAMHRAERQARELALGCATAVEQDTVVAVGR